MMSSNHKRRRSQPAQPHKLDIKSGSAGGISRTPAEAEGTRPTTSENNMRLSQKDYLLSKDQSVEGMKWRFSRRPGGKVNMAFLARADSVVGKSD